ncbi:MAG: tetratricopeptide repeat protein [Wenzhouxiangella sp.]|nr:tetratricopeptide repeat protein [Wenzhouxiangella sp.]
MPSVNDIEQWLVAGDVSRAREACLSLLAQHPADPSLLTLLALCEDASGQPKQALDQLQAICTDHPDQSRALFHWGRLAMAHGQPDQARQALSKAIELEPNHAASRHLLARLAYRSGQVDEAIEGFKTALMADRGYLPALCDLALAFTDVGDTQAALEAATKALKSDKTLPAGHLAMGTVLLAEGELVQAKQHFTQATDLDPDSTQGLVMLAKSHQQCREHREALAALDRLSGADKERLDARRIRALSLVQLGQTRAAQALLEGIVSQAPDVDGVLQLMDLYLHHNSEQALDGLRRQLLDQGAAMAELSELVGAVYCATQADRAHALELFQGLADSPVEAIAIRASLWRARLLLEMGQPSEMILALQHLDEVASPHPMVRLQMAQLAKQAGDVAFAGACLDQALAVEPLPDHLRAELIALHDQLNASPETESNQPPSQRS